MVVFRRFQMIISFWYYWFNPESELFLIVKMTNNDQLWIALIYNKYYISFLFK
jgi:hypothetical protein